MVVANSSESLTAGTPPADRPDLRLPVHQLARVPVEPLHRRPYSVVVTEDYMHRSASGYLSPHVLRLNSVGLVDEI